jgi:hypothetical protein
MAMGCWEACGGSRGAGALASLLLISVLGNMQKKREKQRTADEQEGLQIGKGSGDRADLLCLVLFSFLFLYHS